MDPDCEPLRDYLQPAAKILDPFGLENMRCKWRKWLHFDCNWKVALEAFNETYHVYTTHPEFNRFGEFKGWARAQGKHSNIGYDAPEDMAETQSKIRLGTGDPRISTARDAGLHHGRDQRDHHADAGQRRASGWSTSCPRAPRPTRSSSTGWPRRAATTRPAV